MFAAGGALGVAILLVVVQLVASTQGFQGPLESLFHDYVLTPKSASVPWAGLAIAMVGLTNRQRVVALSAAAVSMSWSPRCAICPVAR